MYPLLRITLDKNYNYRVTDSKQGYKELHEKKVISTPEIFHFLIKVLSNPNCACDRKLNNKMTKAKNSTVEYRNSLKVRN